MRALVLVDHGSRSPEAGHATQIVATALHERLGSAFAIEIAHLEIESPRLPEVLDACVARGAELIVVHPYFLAPGRHASSDVPRLVAEAADRHPQAQFHITPPLGPDPLLAELVLARMGLRERFVVVRQDDHGSRFDVSSHATEAAAQQALAALESLAHKQTYWIERRWDLDRQFP